MGLSNLADLPQIIVFVRSDHALACRAQANDIFRLARRAEKWPDQSFAGQKRLIDNKLLK